MSVISGKLTGAVADRASACPRCAESAKPKPRPARAGVRDDVLTWAGTLTGAVMVVAFGDGVARWFGLGVFLGLLVGAVCAWSTLRAILRARKLAHVHEIHRMQVEGEDRVSGVVRQFEWAINDIARLKRDAERAGLTAEILVQRSRDRERHIHELERELTELRERLAIGVAPRKAVERSEFDMEADAVPSAPFLWGLHHDGYGVNLELECATRTHRPARVRVVDRDGNVVQTSGTPMFNDDEVPGFTLARPPVAMLVDLDTGMTPTYRLEALVDLEWLPVRLDDSGRRTKTLWDKRGRMYRVNAMDENVERRIVH